MSEKKTETLMKVFRDEAGLTQKMIAKKLFVSDDRVSKWERRTGLPPIDCVYDMAELFKVSPVVLFDDFAGKDSLVTWTNKGEYWECSCGLKWKLNQGTPKENEMRFCPKCAGFIVEGVKND